MKIVRKLLMKRVVGSNKVSIQTAAGWLATDKQGDGKKVIAALCAAPCEPVEYYGGGSRENIRLTSCKAAIEFIKEHDGELPFGFE